MRKYIIGSRAFERRKLEEFRDTGDEAVIVRTVETEIKAAEDDARAFDFTISTASVDRYGDTVAIDGWKLNNFRKNAVVLWMHNNSMLPLGKAVNVRIEERKLKSRVEFTPAGVSRFNDTVVTMLQGGFLTATSVGFIPLKYSFVENDPKRGFGIDFLEQELLEFSIVTVPANAEALIEDREFVPEKIAPEIAIQPVFSLDLARRRLALMRMRAAA